MSTETSSQPPELPQRYTAAELNLSRLPFFASSTKNLKDKDGITYTDSVAHEGGEIEIVWEVTGNAKYGYPGPFAESIHSALLDIITERGLPFENPVIFSFYDLCDRLDIKHNGKNIRSIREAILSIRLAGIVIENSFITKDGRRLSHTPDPTFLYKRVALYGDTNPETNEEMKVSAVWLSDFYLQSLNSGNIRPIDFPYFKHLHGRSYAATKIYQYLGYRFSGTFEHNNDYAKVDYDDLATIADVKRQPYLSQAKQKLKKAHEALLDTGFVRRIDWEQEKQPNGTNKFTIYYYPGERARDEYRNGRLQLDQQLDLPLLSEGDDTQSGSAEETLEEVIDQDSPETTSKVFTHELKKLGITAERARKLDQQYSEERITRQLDHLDYLSERGKSPDNPAAWLVSAIQEDYETPDGFKTREEKKAEQKARAKAAKRKKREEEKKEQERREEEERRQRLERRLDKLPEEEQQEIEETIADRLRESHESLIQRVYSGKDIDFKAIPFRADYYNHLEEMLEEENDSQ